MTFEGSTFPGISASCIAMTSHPGHGDRSTGRRETGSSEAVGPAGVDRCALLSNGQLEVLRLVNRHLNSKEIGALLGISSHTVDQRVRGAIQRLGVARRSEAARLVDAWDRAQGESIGLTDRASPPAPTEPTYQRLIPQASDIDAEPDQFQNDGAVSIQIRHADRARGDGAESFETEQRFPRSRSPLFPWSTPHQPRNGWSVGQRLAAITAIAIGASFSAGMFLAGLESLARLVHP